MKIDPCATIADLPKFISQHESYVKNMKPGKARTAYETRLNKVKQLIKE